MSGCARVRRVCNEVKAAAATRTKRLGNLETNQPNTATPSPTSPPRPALPPACLALEEVEARLLHPRPPRDVLPRQRAPRQRRVGQQAHIGLPCGTHLGQVCLKAAPHHKGVAVLDGHDAGQAQLLGCLQEMTAVARGASVSASAERIAAAVAVFRGGGAGWGGVEWGGVGQQRGSKLPCTACCVLPAHTRLHPGPRPPTHMCQHPPG